MLTLGRIGDAGYYKELPLNEHVRFHTPETGGGWILVSELVGRRWHKKCFNLTIYLVQRDQALIKIVPYDAMVHLLPAWDGKFRHWKIECCEAGSEDRINETLPSHRLE